MITAIKFCRFRIRDSVSYGIVEDDRVQAIEGDPFNGYRTGSGRHALAEVELLIPVVPPTFYAIGSNYHNHIVGIAKDRGREPKFYETPRVGYRANSALVPSGADIVKPAASGPRFEYEGEIVAVIGRTIRKVNPQQAAEAIIGWTIGNDVSERDWQAKDPTNIRGKNCDTFNPMGPYLVTGIDIRDMTTTVRLNGKVMHAFPTANMIFSPGEVISSISRYNTLSPGDVVWLGTDEVPQKMKPGDVIEIEITGLGVLRNRVVAEA